MTIEQGADAPTTNGTPLSALLASGVGVFALGLYTTLAEAIPSFKTALVLYKPAGPLSGKTTFAVATWLVFWAISYVVMRGKDYEARRILTVTFALIAVGFLMTFPIFYDLFTAK